MKNFIIVIGQSAAGKTTFVKNTFLTAGENKTENGVKYFTFGKNLALGHYFINKRCEGTDTMSYSILPKAISFIESKKDLYDTFLAEGDRINCRRFFDFVKSLNVPCDVYLLSCSLEESLKRRGDDSKTFVKTTITKSLNMAIYAKSLGFNLIK